MTDDEARKFMDGVHKSYIDRRYFLVSIEIPNEEAVKQLLDMSYNMDEQFKFRILDIAHDSVAVPLSTAKELNSFMSSVARLNDALQDFK